MLGALDLLVALGRDDLCGSSSISGLGIDLCSPGVERWICLLALREGRPPCRPLSLRENNQQSALFILRIEHS
jgi:hypothetical protein